MAMGRINRPSIMVYGGTIRGGRMSSGQVVDIVNAFQSYDEYLAGSIDEGERSEIVRNACPGPGACGGMYTANTMANAIEAMGMSLPYSSSTPATDPAKVEECRGRRVRAHGEGHQAARHHDPGRVRERDGDGQGAWRLHQRGAAPHCDGTGGGCRPHPRALVGWIRRRKSVSGGSGPPGFQFDVALKAQGSSSWTRDCGCAAAIFSVLPIELGQFAVESAVEFQVDLFGCLAARIGEIQPAHLDRASAIDHELRRIAPAAPDVLLVLPFQPPPGLRFIRVRCGAGSAHPVDPSHGQSVNET